MRIFISHASKDSVYGRELVKLLLYVGVPKDNIVFTSQPGYDIPSGVNIFNWLKDRLTEKTFVIYLLSDNYYKSIACLNEMGAAWIAEKEHRTLLIPGFDVNNHNFLSGAIDPREKVVFMEKKESITEFVDFIMRSQQKVTNLNQATEAIDQFILRINEIKEDKLKGTDFETEEMNLDNKMIIDILHNKYADEELLLLKYMIETGTDTLGTGWKEEHELSDIKKWERDEFLTGILSENYTKAVNKFNRRQLIQVDELTSHGNPRQYILKGNISRSLLNLPEKVESRLDDVIKKYNDLSF